MICLKENQTNTIEHMLSPKIINVMVGYEKNGLQTMSELFWIGP